MTCWYHRLPFACFSCPSVFLQRLPYLHDPEFTSDILECLGHFAVSISMQLRKRCDAGAMGAITLLKLWPNSVKSWIMWPRTAKQLFAFQCNSILTSFLDDYLMVHLMINTIERPIKVSLHSEMEFDCYSMTSLNFMCRSLFPRQAFRYRGMIPLKPSLVFSTNLVECWHCLAECGVELSGIHARASGWSRRDPQETWKE